MAGNGASIQTTIQSAALPIAMLALAGTTTTAVVLNIVFDPLVPWGARIVTACLFVPIAALTCRFGRHVFWRGPLIVINDLGIFDRRTMSAILPWNDISSIEGRYSRIYWRLVKSESFEVQLVTRTRVSDDSRNLFGKAILALFRPTPYTGWVVLINLDFSDATLSGFIAACRGACPGDGPEITDNLASVRYTLPSEILWLLFFAGSALATFGAGFALGLGMLITTTEAGEGWFEPIGVAIIYFNMFCSIPLTVQARTALRRLRGIPD